MESQQCDVAQLVFYVNGQRVVEDDPDPEQTLLSYLRDHLRMTGTKYGCGVGGCGACTVMISKHDRFQQQVVHYAVNACLTPICLLHGHAVTTVEGVGKVQSKLHPVQERLAKAHGTQCGFCTPGLVMSMYTLLRNNSQPTLVEIENAIQGNLCRCTGYRSILDGYRGFAEVLPCSLGEDCCRNKQPKETKTYEEPKHPKYVCYDPTQEPIFPSELQLSDTLVSQSIRFKNDRVTWYKPNSLHELLDLKTKYPDAVLVAGNTSVGALLKVRSEAYSVVSVTNIPEMNFVTQTDTGVKFGAATTLTQFQDVLKNSVSKLPEYKTRLFVALIEMLRWIAVQQIRNVATVVGGIMSASPVSDLNPMLLSSCLLTVVSNGGTRDLSMDDNFFTCRRQTAVRPEEIVLAFYIPFSKQNEFFFGYKQSQKRDNSSAIVNAGMKVVFEEETNVIQKLHLCFGGMGPTTVIATKTSQQLVGSKWEDDLVGKACELLQEDLPLSSGSPGGMVPYRRTLTASLFFKFYLGVQTALHSQEPSVSKTTVPSTYQSVAMPYHRDMSSGTQVYEEVPPDQPETDPVGRPLLHMSAFKHTTGEAIFCDDLPVYKDELFLALVGSTKSHANIINVDQSEALSMPGVVDYINYKDIPGLNLAGIQIQDEEIFAETKVVCQGQAIGGILARSRDQARKAVKAVKIEYEELKPITTIEEAIQAGAYHMEEQVFKKGDIEAGFKSSDHVIEGEVQTGGQEHFYLETNVCLVVPSEDGEIELFSSTQNADLMQSQLSSTLDIPANKIVVRVKRVGGGFGGKDTQPLRVVLPSGVAALKHKKPVRCCLERWEDMVMTGTRHPFLARYKVGFTQDGTILALEVAFFCNAGCSLDKSFGVILYAFDASDNCYLIPNYKITGRICKTNISSNTAFRAFGTPQAQFICETWIQHMADILKIAPDVIRKQNLYKKGDVTFYGIELEDSNVQRCWDEVIKQSEFHQQKDSLDLFNNGATPKDYDRFRYLKFLDAQQHRWKKRGLAVVPCKFRIGFDKSLGHMNQAGALVHVYLDGSVLLTFGGIEMGQGLFTKMIQIASRVFKIPASTIHVSETSTAKVPNPTLTGGSIASDYNGMAVMRACQTIRERLNPFIEANLKGTWKDWVNAAYLNRVSLSATGFYSYPKEQQHYYTFGAACSVVEIDCLTGDHTVLQTDIVMDVGRSLNPGIDVGQIEGGFLQGYGLHTVENYVYDSHGKLLTRGPDTYKIPSITDIPVKFNVTLLKGASNPKAVYSSKGIGEPPLILASSVFFAIKDAISAARLEAALSGHFQMDSPATAEKIRMACVDRFTK